MWLILNRPLLSTPLCQSTFAIGKHYELPWLVDQGRVSGELSEGTFFKGIEDRYPWREGDDIVDLFGKLGQAQ